MAIKRTTKVDSGFSMSSMTDIVFLLLIFFLVTSTLINPNALKLLLPKSTGQVSAKATVSVSIKHWQNNDTFSYHINGEETPIRFDEIEDGLIELLQSEEDPTNLPLFEISAISCASKKLPKQQRPGVEEGRLSLRKIHSHQVGMNQAQNA